MKKKIRAIIALLMAAVLLTGCAGVLTAGDRMRQNMGKGLGFTTESLTSRGILEMRPFDEMAYVRPDLDALRENIAAVERALDGGESVQTVMDRLDECYEAYYSFQTMYTLADLRACHDMTDAYYAEEYAWCDDNYPVVRQLIEELYLICGRSSMAGELEKRYFWTGFAEAYGEDTDASYNEVVVALMRQESALLTEYRALLANPTIEMHGEEHNYHEYLADLDDWEWDEAEKRYYEKYNGELSRVFIKLVQIRQALASALGYDSYEQMQYDYFFQRDYSPQEAAAYMADIKTYMVPFYKEVMARNPYRDIRYDFLSDERLHEILGSAARKIGGEVREAYDFLSAYKLYDIEVSPVKADMSFQAYLEDYEAPFIFLNPYGDMEDVLSYSHEFGHYVDSYVNYDAYETIDVSECFSQGMELLMLSYYGDALSQEEIDNLTRMKMLDTIDTYVQEAAFTEFETVIYSTDPAELSTQFINDLSLRLAKEYGYYDGSSDLYYSMCWMDISHFFEQPFYVVTYPVSNDAAMQLYELEQREEGLGVEKYLEMLPREYQGLIDTLQACGLESPFTPGRIQQVVEDMRPRLIW